MFLKIKFIFVIFIISSGILFSQSSSVYSRFGIGDPVYSYSGRGVGLTKSGTSTAVPDFVSISNPASWYVLKKARFEAAVNYNGTFLKSKSESSYYGKAQFNGFTFGFPVSQKYGIGAVTGIVPFTNVSYKSVSKYTSPDPEVGSYSTTYEGQGGLSKLFLGSSYKLPFDLVIGASLDYYFGNLEYFSNITFDNQSNSNASYLRKYSPNGLGYSFGLISPDLSQIINIDNVSNFRVGASFINVSKLKTDTSFTSTSSLGTDTLGFNKVYMKIPYRLSAGLSFMLDNKYLLSLDYVYQPWSDYALNNINSPYLRNSNRFSAGFEYRPKADIESSFWEQIILRLGLSYEQTQYIINNQGINRFSVAGGFSLPLAAGNTIDIGIEYSIKGTNNDNLFKENNLRINFGISLGEIWFVNYIQQ